MTQANIPMRETQSTMPTSSRTLPFNLTWTLVALAAIVVIAAGLRLIDITSVGDGNTYYTAAVENMLQSPSNFFYAVADAGGVTVDKPPVALWVQAIFGAVLGVTGFTVTLPSILAGVLSVLLLYHLVKKQRGTTAGLIAAFVLAVTPVSVAVDRTNNLDSILIFTLLLATWAFICATETGKWRHLLLGAVLIGVGFNIKMLQAYLIVPALYALYFFGASVSWRRKIVQLAVTGIVLAAVSLSWALIVDLTPADQRPYVGGSDSNSVLELALGYNGMSRLLGNEGPGSGGVRPGDDGQQGLAPPANDGAAVDDGPPGDDGPGGGSRPGGSDETGEAGVTRLFETALANELAWLLPFGLLGTGLLIFRRRITLPAINREHQAVVLWGGWLLTGVVFFSVSGFFHAYYLATLAPALAALVGITAVVVWQMVQETRRRGLLIAAVLLIVTLAYQLVALGLYDAVTLTLVLPVGVALVVLAAGWMLKHRYLMVAGYLAALLIVPAFWATVTATETNNTTLPQAYTGETNGNFQPGMATNVDSGIYDDIESTIQGSGDWTYDLVVDSSMTGSRITLNTDLDVLYLGGFNGMDGIYTAESFAELVEAGEVGYVLAGNDEIGQWVSNQCMAVEGLSLGAGFGGGMRPPQGDGGFTPPPQGAGGPPGMSGGAVYYCGAQS